MSIYDDTHRRFLKSLMSTHAVAQDKAVDLFCSCRDANKNPGNATQDLGNDSDKAVVKFIDQINTKIEPLNLSIKLITCEATNKKFYVLHTVNENEITKAAAGRQRGRNERALLKVVIKAIVKSPTGKVSFATCARECAELPEKIKRNDVTKIIKKLVMEKWLAEVNDQIYIGPRAMAELGKYLKDEYGEVVAPCKLCKDFTLRGPSCPSNCGVRSHLSCLKSYFSKVTDRRCMGCKKPWPALEAEADAPTPVAPVDSEEDEEAMEVE